MEPGTTDTVSIHEFEKLKNEPKPNYCNMNINETY